MDDSFLYPFLNRPKVRVKNASGFAIPTGGVMRVTDGSFVGKNAVVTVSRPDNTLRRRYLVNCGPTINAATDSPGWGSSLIGIDGLVLYDNNAVSVPALDEWWGPFPNSFLLHKGYPGFFITGGTQDFGTSHGVIATQSPTTLALGTTQSSIHASATTGAVTILNTIFTVSGCANYGPYIHSNLLVEVIWVGQSPIVRRLDSGILMCQTSTGMSLGTTDSACKVLDFGGNDTGDTIAVVNRYFSAGIGASKRIAVAYSATNGGQYHAINTEHASAP